MVLHHQSKNNSKQSSGSEEIKLEKPIDPPGSKIFPDMLFSQNHTAEQYI